MLIDRDYQVEAVGSIFNFFQEDHRVDHNPIVAMPVGTGKSVVIARFLQRVFNLYSGQKILCLTHVKELIEQNYKKLLEAWAFAPAGIFSAGIGRKDINFPIIFAGIASIVNKAALFGHVDLILIDEVHLVSPEDQTMYRRFICALQRINPKLRLVGFTATPWRMGQGMITEPYEKRNGTVVEPLFTDFCIDLTKPHIFNRFFAEGYLSPVIPKRTETQLDVEGVHLRGGDFLLSELQNAVDKETTTRMALEEALDIAANRRKWLVFSSGVEHAIHTAEMFNDFGVKAVAIHGKMTKTERDNAISGYKQGFYKVAVNNNILTTGFDCPDIDLIMMLRPTLSTVLWVQMLGRGTRPLYVGDYDLSTIDGRLSSIADSPKQNCLVLDYATNTKRLGPINDPVIPRSRGQKGGVAPTKLCPSCDTWIHASLRFCNGITKEGKDCKHEFEFQNKLQSRASTESIIKDDLPIVEVFKVDRILYSVHEKNGSPDSLRVQYLCNLRTFNEYVLLEHSQWVARKAQKWWQERGQWPVPATVEEALERVGELKVPTHLRVWVNKKYPEIMSVCYDGTAWGKHAPSKPPTVAVDNYIKESEVETGNTTLDMDEDEIPF